MRIDGRQLNRIALYGLFGLCIFLFQTVVVSHLAIFGTKPFLPLVATVTIAVIEGPRVGATFGAILGFICEVTASQIVGLYALLLLVVGLVGGILIERYFWRSLPAAALLYVMAYGLCMICTSLWHLPVLLQPALLPGVLFMLVKEMLYSVVFFPPLYWLVQRMHRHLSSLE